MSRSMSATGALNLSGERELFSLIVRMNHGYNEYCWAVLKGENRQGGFKSRNNLPVGRSRRQDQIAQGGRASTAEGETWWCRGRTARFSS